jgi:hypothetical protein
MLEELAFVLLWIAFLLIILWAFLRFSPSLIKFFRTEIKQAKKNISMDDAGAETKKDSKRGDKDA